jgi:hypothetical protein
LTSTCNGRSPGASSSSSSRALASRRSGWRRGRASGRGADRSTASRAPSPRNVVQLLSHGSCSSTSRPSAVRHASVSRPSTGPASVARSAARDESGRGSRPRRCAYNGGSVATTIKRDCLLLLICRAPVTDRLSSCEQADKPTERRVCARVRWRGPGSWGVDQQLNNPAMTDLCDMNDLITVDGGCLTRVDHRSDSPQSTGRSARGKTRRRGAIFGERRDTGGRSNYPSRAHSGRRLRRSQHRQRLSWAWPPARAPSRRVSRVHEHSDGDPPVSSSAAPGRWGSMAMSGCPDSQCGLPEVGSRSVIPLAASSWETSQPLATNQPMPAPADEPEQNFEAWFT